MKKSPYIIISTAMSLDGYIDNTSDEPLIISNREDFDRVDALRTSCDAVLVGANTVRKDNPKLLIKSQERKNQRTKNGLAADPIKVTLTTSGNINRSSAFFTTGDTEKIVYTVTSQAKTLDKHLSTLATVVSVGDATINLKRVLRDLYDRGVRRLLIEGGSTVLTQFLQEGLVDELHIAIAGFFVGQKDAARLVRPGVFPWNAAERLRLESVTKLDDIAVLIYKA